MIPDQRGYNLSDQPKGLKPYRVDALVEDICGLIDALEYEKVNLVGHDWGAVVALVAANAIRRSARSNAFTDEDIEKYKEAWGNDRYAQLVSCCRMVSTAAYK